MRCVRTETCPSPVAVVAGRLHWDTIIGCRPNSHQKHSVTPGSLATLPLSWASEQKQKCCDCCVGLRIRTRTSAAFPRAAIRVHVEVVSASTVISCLARVAGCLIGRPKTHTVRPEWGHAIEREDSTVVGVNREHGHAATVVRSSAVLRNGLKPSEPNALLVSQR